MPVDVFISMMVRRHTAIDTLTQKMLISGCQLPLKPILFGMIVTRLFRRQELDVKMANMIA